MARSDVDVRESGPLFNGTAARAARAGAAQVADEVAEAGADMLRDATSVFRQPTGHYKGSVRTDRARDRAVITDGGIVYGPWLEGSADRNKGSSFKGYRIWRRTRQRLDRAARPIAETAMHPYVRMMG